MTKALVLLGGILFFKIALPRRAGKARQRPYGSALDIAVPPHIACSLLVDPELAAKAEAARAGPVSSNDHAMLGA